MPNSELKPTPKPTFTPTLAASGFALPITKNCPITRKSHGIITMPPELLAAISTAVTDRHEWAIILYGKREQGGFMVRVEKIAIPPTQRRTSGNVDIDEVDLTPDVVGVLHSHHTMGAFFSGTDNDHFNDKFPTSIVVAVPKAQTNTAGPIAKTLGFDYKAEGRVKLPCGALAVVKFRVVPDQKKVKDWPEARELQLPLITHDEKDTNLGDCSNPNSKIEKKRGYLKVKEIAACGIERTHIPEEAFGENAFILNALPESHKPVVVVSSYGKYYGQYDGQYGYYNNGQPYQSYRPQTLEEANAERAGLALIGKPSAQTNQTINQNWAWVNYTFRITGENPLPYGYGLRPEHLNEMPTALIKDILAAFRRLQFKSPEDIALDSTTAGWALFQKVFRDTLTEYLDEITIPITDKITALKSALWEDSQKDSILTEEEVVEIMEDAALIDLATTIGLPNDLVARVLTKPKNSRLVEGRDYIEINSITAC